jgi:hypothetical protein
MKKVNDKEIQYIAIYKDTYSRFKLTGLTVTKIISKIIDDFLNKKKEK